MPTLSPFAMLVLYIAMAVAPSSSHRVEVPFTPTIVITLIRDAHGRWTRTDDLGNQNYWNIQVGKIRIEDGSGNGETYDLADSDLTIPKNGGELCFCHRNKILVHFIRENA